MSQNNSRAAGWRWLLCLAAGVALLAFAWLWPGLVAGRSDVDAKRWAEASAELHRQTHLHAHAHEHTHGGGAAHAHAHSHSADTHAAAGAPAEHADLLAARQRFAEEQARLHADKTRGRSLAAIAFWLGGALALAGAGGYFWTTRHGA